MTLVVSVLSSAISLLYGVAAARWFGAEGRGDVVAFMYWPALVGAIAPLGVPVAVGYYAAHEPEHAGEVAGTGLFVATLFGVISSTVLLAATPLLLGDATPEVMAAARVFSIAGLLIGVMTAAQFPLRVMHRNGTWNMLRLLGAAIPLLALGVLALLLGSKGLAKYSWLMIAFQALGAAAAIVALARAARVRVSFRWVKPLLRYGFPTILAMLPLLLSIRLDQAFLIRDTSRSELGNYAAAFAWSRAVPAATEFLSFMALPRLAPLRGQERLTEQEHLLRLSSLLTLAVAIPLALVSPFIVPLLFGEEFRLAGQLSLVLVPAAGVLGIVTLTEEILRAEHRLRTPIVAQVVGLVVAVAGLAVVVPIAGSWGAAAVSLLTYTVVCAVMGVALHDIGVPGPAPFLLPRRRQFAVVVEPLGAGWKRWGPTGRRSSTNEREEH